MHRRSAALLLAITIGCADEPSPVEGGNPHLLPGELGRILAEHAPPGPEGIGIQLAYAGTLSPVGLGIAHLPPEAGTMTFQPLIRCYIRQADDQPYTEIHPVEDSPVPCGFSSHETHLDAITESTTTPSWLANIVVLVP